MSQGKGSNGRMAIIAILAVTILAISLRILMSMETSLEEGRGPQGGTPFAILSLMVLIVALILLTLTQIRSGLGQFTTDKMRIAALMAAMFITGMLIEPAIPRPEAPAGSLGAIFILIPVLLIAAMLVPMIPSRSDEEE